MNKAFEVVFNDDYLVVVNKIAKVLIQPSPKKEKVTLTSILRRQLKRGVFPCHRLDRETTGLVIYAKTRKVQREIMDEFRRGEVKKKYIAFVKDKLKKKKGLLNGYIIDKEGKAFGEKSKWSKTIYKVLAEFRGFSSLELIPLTGRTNQIRIQLAEINHPVLGESKYAFRRDFEVKFKRLALHACFLSLIHPASKERINLSIELPQDMEEFLKARSYGL